MSKIKADDLLNGVLTQTLNLSEEDIATLHEAGEFTEEGQKRIFDALAEKMSPKPVNATKEQLEEARREGYGRAKKEERVAFEKEIQSEFGLSTDKTGMGLITELINLKSGSKDDKHLRDTISLLEKNADDFKSKFESTQTELEQTKANYEKEKQEIESFGVVRSEAIRALKESKAVLPKNPSASEVQQRNYVDSFKGITIKEMAGKKVLYKGEEMLQDRFQNPITFDQYAENIIKTHFDTQEDKVPPAPPSPNQPTIEKAISFTVEGVEDYQAKRAKIESDTVLTSDEKGKAKIALSDAFDEFKKTQP